MKVSSGTRPRYGVILFFLRRFKLLFGTVLLVTIVSSILESVGVMAFFPVFSSLLGDSQGGPGGILGFIAGLAGLLPIANPTVAASALLIMVFLAKTLVNLLRAVLAEYATAKVLYSIKQQIMERYAAAHYQFHLDSKQGALIYNSVEVPGSVASVLGQGTNLVTFLLKVLSITVLLVAILPQATVAIAALGVGYYAGVHYLSSKVIYHIGVRNLKAHTEQMVIANEFFNGFRQIITANAVKLWVGRFDRESRTIRELMVREAVWLAVPRPAIELIAVALMLGIIQIMWVTGADTIAQSLPTIGVFAVGLSQLLPPLASVGGARMAMMGGLPSAELAHQAITGPIPMRKDGFRVLGSFEKAISFENVSFAYSGREPLFKDLNLTFEKGKVTAIVGPSGAGKTSIVNLMLGLFEPTQGRITVDGVPLHEFKQESWLSKIGFVSQDLFMYHASIADNIRFDRDGHSIESTINAAKIANAHGFISEFPQGYDTIVGDRGMTLSGGQQQRLAIARAILETPEILILDEATSSLDTISEQQVQDAIDKVSSHRTVIIIAHRLSTIRHADKIIVVDNGQVIEEGSHQELLTSNGHYSRLVAAQR